MGDLTQIDGSEHWWFESRRPQCTLLVFVDDATSRLMHLRFVETESTFDYFVAARTHLQRYGKPIAFYSDMHRAGEEAFLLATCSRPILIASPQRAPDLPLARREGHRRIRQRASYKK
jgi:hypothetical protein